jgi:hypothetical protein
MQIGTKTLLYGNHQFLVHPFFVGIAWVRLYRKLPNPKEALCILIHDWGYWGKPNIDGPEGEEHPFAAAMWAHEYLDGFYRKWYYKNTNPFRYQNLCLYHSGTLAKRHGNPVSRLYMPDKIGIASTPIWLLTLCGKLSGETEEYRHNPKYPVTQRQSMSDYQLYADIRNYYHNTVIPQFMKEQGK